MAVSFCYGTVGSGKTYDAMCRILQAMCDQRKVVTINMELKHPNIKKYLLEQGMTHFDADRVIGEHEHLFTEGRFRELRGSADNRIYLCADEAHFWWPQNSHHKISLEDVLQVAMSRKKFLDLHIISQLNGQINREVAGLSSDNWLARPLKIEPFYSGLKIYTRLARATGGRGRPAAFWYTRVEDELGKTQGRKDGSLDPDNKRMRFLQPLIASCYDTLQVVSSPVLDRMRDEARFEYYVNILKGKVKPQAVCPVCSGTRVYRYALMFAYHDQRGGVERVPYHPDLLASPDYIAKGEDDCTHCEERGYIYPDDHPDYAEAQKFKDKIDLIGRRKTNVKDE